VNPKVSLIASVFNGDKFLNKYIKNIIALDNFENMELILVDANSCNPLKKKLEVYLETYPNIKVVTLKTTNTIYESWNLAIEMASGEYLTNVNVDDLRLKSAVKAQATFLDENHQVDVIYGNYIYSFKPNTSIEAALKLNISTNLPALTTHNLLEFNSPHCAPMWRKSLHLEIGHFDESFKSAGDWEFWLRAAKAEKKFACLKDPIAIYYWNPKGISTSPTSAGVSEQWEIRKRYRQLLIDESVTIGSIVS
jgi:glycosyltransferase involved in cell wall biosynthesis